MEFYLFLLVITFVWKSTFSLQCYHCIPERTIYEPNGLLCDTFDGSDKFIVDCPYSTMCHKKVILFQIREATYKYVERSCALQTTGPRTNPREQVKRNHTWVYEIIIHEPYDDGCKEESIELGKSTQTNNCYCRGDFCNKASSIGAPWSVALVGIIWIAKFI